MYNEIKLFQGALNCSASVLEKLYPPKINKVFSLIYIYQQPLNTLAIIDSKLFLKAWTQFFRGLEVNKSFKSFNRGVLRVITIMNMKCNVIIYRA